jgi:hypothetical protein
MPEMRVTETGHIDAPMERVYAVLSNYRDHHPKILPAAFSGWKVEQGGIGAGTVIRFRVTTAGRTRDYHQRVEEPDPPRVLVERGISSSEVTTFRLRPDGDAACWLRIDTTWQRSSGLEGLFERLFAPLLLRRLYRDELRRLNEYARRARLSNTDAPC